MAKRHSKLVTFTVMWLSHQVSVNCCLGVLFFLNHQASAFKLVGFQCFRHVVLICYSRVVTRSPMRWEVTWIYGEKTYKNDNNPKTVIALKIYGAYRYCTGGRLKIFDHPSSKRECFSVRNCYWTDFHFRGLITVHILIWVCFWISYHLCLDMSSSPVSFIQS